MRQWYERARGGLFGHAAKAGGDSLHGAGIGADETGRERAPFGVQSGRLAPRGAEAVGANEWAQGVCDTVRTDRDGGYPCL